jgi:chromosome segregation ATPase
MARRTLIVGVLVPLLLVVGVARAADDPEVEQLRAQLRSTVLQLRELQDQQATAQAKPAPPAPAQAADKARLARAEAQLRAARHAAAAAATAQAALVKAQADNARLTSAAAATGAELAKFKTAFAQSEEAGRALTLERDQLKSQLTRMSNVATACQAKNVRLTAFAEDLLAAYRKVGFSQVMAAREPFLGLKRVQLENIAQDREDKVRAARCDAVRDAVPPKPAG